MCLLLISIHRYITHIIQTHVSSTPVVQHSLRVMHWGMSAGNHRRGHTLSMTRQFTRGPTGNPKKSFDNEIHGHSIPRWAAVTQPKVRAPGQQDDMPDFIWYASPRLLGALQWHHNGLEGVSHHHPHDCLLKRLFRRRSKKTSKLRDTGLSEGNSPVTGEFPAQRASNAENVSIWWRHHGVTMF